jgi:hypothetical protein
MESIANWRLLHRSREQLHALVRNAGFQDKSVSITKDGTGLTYLANVQFPAAKVDPPSRQSKHDAR